MQKQKEADAARWQKEALFESDKIRQIQYKIGQLQLASRNADADARGEDRRSFDYERQASAKRSEASRLQSSARGNSQVARVVDQLLREADSLSAAARRAGNEASAKRSRRFNLDLDIRFAERDLSVLIRSRNDYEYKAKLFLKEAKEMQAASLKAPE